MAVHRRVKTSPYNRLATVAIQQNAANSDNALQDWHDGLNGAVNETTRGSK